MLENLTDRLSHVVKTVTGNARLSEDNIRDALREVRVALLEADVALPVVKKFIEGVKEKALGIKVQGRLTPSQVFISLVNEALTHLMGQENSELDLAVAPPAVVLMSGLQGVGKTTTVGKLAYFLLHKKKAKKKILVVSTDVYRPAAMDQLKLLAEQVGVDFYPSVQEEDPVTIAQSALNYAKRHYYEVLLIDTAGRLAIDEKMMQEISALQKAVEPIETLFVIDSMLGQDAVNVAKAFNESLDLTGVILTKMDGDTRGGAALSVREVTGKPIKFIGVGEKINNLEPFYPDRLADRILGMGDMLTLIEEVKEGIDQKTAEKMVKKLHKGKSFDLNDFYSQLQQLKNMGGIESIMSKLPGAAQLVNSMPQGMAEKAMMQTEAIINSMTPVERRHPQILKASRKRRIAQGSGTTIQDINKLLRQFEQMKKMMKQFSGGGMGKLLKVAQGMKGLRDILPGR